MKTKMKPIVDPEEMFPKVEKMIYSQAWKFANAYPISFQEAKTEAYFAFVKACYDYKPDRGQKFSSWCYYWVWCKLKDLITSRTVDPHLFVDMMPTDPEEIRKVESLVREDSDLKTTFLEELEEITIGISEDAKRLLNLIINTPQDLLAGKPATPRQLLMRAKKFLIAEGNQKCNVEAAQRELHDCFKEAWT